MARTARRAGRQARSAGLLLTALALACANVGDPPGGPPDTAPPAILAVQPESGSVVPNLKGDAVIQFDEVIDEGGGAGGAGGGGGGGGGGAGLAGLERQVVLSPVAGAVKVSWHRSSIHIAPKEGWKRGRVYRLELLPGIVDLRRNRLATGRTLIFSTGPALPTARIEGTVVQWVEQRLLPQAVIAAALRPDTVPYLTLADSTGHFRLDGIPAGRYILYAVADLNNNRRRDRREPYDSVEITLDTLATTALWTFVHDTAGPRLRTAEPVDSLTGRLTFSQALDPATRLDTSNVRVLALPDSTPVRIRALLTPTVYDSITARERAVADSLRKAADTTARRDTTSAERIGVPAPAAAQRGPAAGTGAQQPSAAKIDTTALRQLLSQRPVPTDKLMLRFIAPVTPGGKYLVRLTGAMNLNGARADGSAVLTVPAPAKPAAQDTTRAPRDTTRTRTDTTRVRRDTTP